MGPREDLHGETRIFRPLLYRGARGAAAPRSGSASGRPGAQRRREATQSGGENPRVGGCSRPVAAATHRRQRVAVGSRVRVFGRQASPHPATATIAAAGEFNSAPGHQQQPHGSSVSHAVVVYWPIVEWTFGTRIFSRLLYRGARGAAAPRSGSASGRPGARRRREGGRRCLAPARALASMT